jgi:hypothetical protein
LRALDVAGTSLASPIAVAAAAVERVLRSLAGKHRPPIAPPVFFPLADIEVGRKSPMPAVDAPRLLDALRLHFSAFVIDHDEMQADGI